MRPARTAVGRFVNTVANREVGSLESLTAAGIDDLRIAWRYRERADRTSWFAIEDRHPSAARVVALPNATVDGAYKEEIWLIRRPIDCDRAPSAQRTDEPPVQGSIERRCDALRACTGTPDCKRDRERRERRISAPAH